MCGIISLAPQSFKGLTGAGEITVGEVLTVKACRPEVRNPVVLELESGDRKTLGLIVSQPG